MANRVDDRVYILNLIRSSEPTPKRMIFRSLQMESLELIVIFPS